MPAHAVDTGTLLSGRYRLEQRLGDDVGGTTRWRADDELLNRRVELRALPADAPGTAQVMAAARRAAQIADPRFVRILDAGEDDGHAWVVSEWVDAHSLRELLAAGPLPTREARRIAAALAEGLAAAHAAGLSHRCLGPDHVLRAESGQVKVVGLEVEAALASTSETRGIPTECSQDATPVDPTALDGGGPNGSGPDGSAPDGSAPHGSTPNGSRGRGKGAAPPDPSADPPTDPAALDAAGIGAVLYAALTARWPLEAATALPAAPYVDGHLCSPRQVRAGVPADLDDIACRALAGMPRRGAAPLRSPAEVAAALAVSANGNGGSTSALPVIGVDDGADGDAPGRFAAPAEPSRAARTVRTVSAVVLAAGLALAGWQLLVAVVERDDGPVRRPRGSAASTPPPSAPAPTGTVLRPVAAQDFDPPPGNGEEYPERVRWAVDGNPATAWRTMSYKNRPNLGGAKEGVGLLLDLGTDRRVTSVTLQLEGRGTALEIRGGATKPSVAADLALLASEPAAGPLVTLPLDSDRQVRWLLVWLTKLPAGDRADEYRGGISEITVRG